MKTGLLILLILAAISSNGRVHACYIMNEEKVEIGSFDGIRGICSNNQLPVSCILMEGVGVECDGPSGGYTGYDLQSLIYYACGCSQQEERERQLKQYFNTDVEEAPHGIR